MKIRLVGAELFDADGRAFRNLGERVKKWNSKNSDSPGTPVDQNICIWKAMLNAGVLASP
jgi:hypothetical protein